MNRREAFWILAVLGSFSVSAQADPVAPVPSETISEPKPDPEVSTEKKVCRTITVTGSRIPQKKVCKTKADWDAMTDQNQDGMRDRQRSTRNWRPDAG